MKIRGLQPIIFPESVVYQKISENKVSLRGEGLNQMLQGEAEAISKSSKKAIFKDEIATPLRLAIKEKRAETKIGKTTLPSLISEIRTLLDAGDYTAVVESVKDIIKRDPNNLNACCLLAETYANLGEYDRAVPICKKAIDIDATAVKPYFLLAHIVEAKGNIDEAKSLLKKVIYLDPAFIPAYLELGAIYDNENDSERARKMRLTAIDLIGSLHPEAVIEPYRDINAEELLRYVKKMIDSREK